MSYIDQFQEIADSGDIDTIQKCIDSFEEQKAKYGLTKVGLIILTNLYESLKHHKA